LSCGRRSDDVGPLCISKQHLVPVPATVLMQWVDGPVTYCDPCAVGMRRVAKCLSVHVHEERIERPNLDDGRARRLRT